MDAIKYQEYLNSDYWKKIRKKVILRANGQCENCQSKTKRLQVHHCNYDFVGNENIDALLAICDDCHYQLHYPQKRRKKKRPGLKELRKAIRYKCLDCCAKQQVEKIRFCNIKDCALYSYRPNVPLPGYKSKK